MNGYLETIEDDHKSFEDECGWIHQILEYSDRFIENSSDLTETKAEFIDPNRDFLMNMQNVVDYLKKCGGDIELIDEEYLTSLLIGNDLIPNECAENVTEESILSELDMVIKVTVNTSRGEFHETTRELYD